MILETACGDSPAQQAYLLTKEETMAKNADIEFSSADPDDEIDLESLVKKAPAPKKPVAQQQKRETASKAVQEDVFDVSSLPSKEPQKKPAASTAPVSSTSAQETPAGAAIMGRPDSTLEGETDSDSFERERKNKVRILPEFPTLILIILVSIATAFVTGIIVRMTAPSLDSKMQEILSNQENTSVKVNALEQNLSKTTEELKALQDAQSRQSGADKKHKAK